jgi:hypothetical protein
LWFVTGLVAAAPAPLVLAFARSSRGQVAGTLLLVAGAVALVLCVALRRLSSLTAWTAGGTVVVLCATAPLFQAMEGRIFLIGWFLCGGAAAVLGWLALAATVPARGA